MENNSAQASNLQENKPLVYSEKDPAIFFAKIKNFFNRKFVKMALFLIIALLITIPVGLFINQQYQKYKISKEKIAASAEKIKAEYLNTNGSLKTWGENNAAVSGEITEKGSNNFTILTKHDYMPVTISADTYFEKSPFVASEKERTGKSYLQKSSFSELKKGDFVDVTGKLGDKSLVATHIVLRRQ